MIVDENVQEIKNIQTLMGDMGILTDTAIHAEEALKMIQDAGSMEQSYHLVLLDWETQDAGYIQMAERIRRTLPETSILLLMTDHNEDSMDDMAEILQFGYTGDIVKPVFVSDLKEKVMEIQAEESGKGIASEQGEENILQGLHFLAAEDNEINAEILFEILSMEGASCEVAGNGQLVLERFIESEEGKFDAILMDVQMPVMNGYDATRAIRALPRKDAAEIPIFAMTANAFAEDEKEALQAGMNIHLAKPIDMDALKKAVKQYVYKEDEK